MPDAPGTVKQYCRYCLHCIVKPDFDIWCDKLQKNIIEKSAKAKNYCKLYEHTKFDAYNPQNIYKADLKKEESLQQELFK